MAQITSGIRRVLGNPFVYEAFQTLVGAARKRKKLVRDYIKPFPGMRILDVGCGPAEILEQLNENVDYLGIDLSEEYIAKARKKHSHRGRFLVQHANKVQVTDDGFDIAMAIGLLHHLEDNEVTALMDNILRKLKPGGRMLTVDGVFIAKQNPIARFLLKKDRGQNVRWEHEYVSLAEKVFGVGNVQSTVRDDLTRIPYNHCILECRKMK